MRVSRFGLLVLIAISGYFWFVATRLTRIPPPPLEPPRGPAASVDEVKSDLCKLAAAEREFHRITGSYATESELRANDIDDFPTLAPWPYRYLVSVPTPDVFSIVAMHYGPLNDGPAAVVTDQSGQVCVVRPLMRSALHDPRPQGSDGLAYDCELCGDRTPPPASFEHSRGHSSKLR